MLRKAIEYIKLYKYFLYKDYLQDAAGREFRDPLSQFFRWYFKNGSVIPYPPAFGGLSYTEDIRGIVLYRSPNFQVELFLTPPNFKIPYHHHPDVDSYEVGLCGIEFYHTGKTIVTMEQALTARPDNTSISQRNLIRVKPLEKHAALSGPQGGAFLSVQHWLHGVKPTCVADNWDGYVCGDKHMRHLADNGLDENAK